MLQFTVNAQRCTRCGECVRDCPARIIHLPADATPGVPADQEAQCLQCQHCLAICPAGAISIFGRNPDASLPLSPAVLPSLEQMSRLVRGRRSIRQYRNENVDPTLLRELLATLANVPTGVNRRELTFNVIDDRDAMQRLREKILNALATAINANRIPEQAVFLHAAVPAYYQEGRDLIFRTAPHALIVSAPPDAPCPREDVALALASFDLLARSAGLGTVWWGMLKVVLETLPELKALLGLPAEHVYYAMLFGPPAIRFPRTVQRDDAAQVRSITL